jgi:hypothetical protein
MWQQAASAAPDPMADAATAASAHAAGQPRGVVEVLLPLLGSLLTGNLGMSAAEAADERGGAGCSVSVLSNLVDQGQCVEAITALLQIEPLRLLLEVAARCCGAGCKLLRSDARHVLASLQLGNSEVERVAEAMAAYLQM